MALILFLGGCALPSWVPFLGAKPAEESAAGAASAESAPRAKTAESAPRAKTVENAPGAASAESVPARPSVLYAPPTPGTPGALAGAAPATPATPASPAEAPATPAVTTPAPLASGSVLYAPPTPGTPGALAAAVATPAAAAPHLAERLPGEEEFARGDYAAAQKALAPALTQGNPRAAFYLRIIAEYGLAGGPPSPQEAAVALDALRLKYPEIKALATRAPLDLRPLYQTALGTLYFKGLIPGEERNLGEARRWAQFAAYRDFTPAMNLLSAIATDPQPPASHWVFSVGPGEAFGWASKAAKLGDPLAMGNLSVLYREGLGTDLDLLKAVNWAFRAASLKPPLARAQNDLGAFHEDGKVMSLDLAEAKKWYRLAEGRYALAKDNLQRLKGAKPGPPLLAKALDY
ncbi:MAG: sel1 repeat family protein [Deltaproteobacteria bacterium]|nr:sel1 repeat family protein [Deltaproteobacteria bacterium]